MRRDYGHLILVDAPAQFKAFDLFDWTSLQKRACVGAKGAAAMDAQTQETTLKAYISEMRDRLDQAAGIGRAAKACAEAGNISKAIEIALDVEQLIYEVSTFLNAASLIHRISKS